MYTIKSLTRYMLQLLSAGQTLDYTCSQFLQLSLTFHDKNGMTKES